MKIAFLGLQGTFDFFQIGGTDSFMRRLTLALLDQCKELQISWVFYGSEYSSRIVHTSRFASIYLPSFEDALTYLVESGYSHVISAYLMPRDRMKFAWFRARNRKIRFHSLVFFFPESRVQRFAKFSEYLMFPYSGQIFCVSKRQLDYLQKLSKRVVYLPPIVPNDYFLHPWQKSQRNELEVAFVGRVDPRKGIQDVIRLYMALDDAEQFNCIVYGIHIPQDQAALKIHQWLKTQDRIRYVEVKREAYSPATEEMVKQVLKDMDILVLPYRTLDSTVDTPLLLLEGMASLCVVLTTSVGDIPHIYGPSKFIVDTDNFVPTATRLLHELTPAELRNERNRIYNRIATLDVCPNVVARRFLDALV